MWSEKQPSYSITLTELLRSFALVRRRRDPGLSLQGNSVACQGLPRRPTCPGVGGMLTVGPEPPSGCIPLEAMLEKPGWHSQS